MSTLKTFYYCISRKVFYFREFSEWAQTREIKNSRTSFCKEAYLHWNRKNIFSGKYWLIHAQYLGTATCNLQLGCDGQGPTAGRWHHSADSIARTLPLLKWNSEEYMSSFRIDIKTSFVSSRLGLLTRSHLKVHHNPAEDCRLQLQCWLLLKLVHLVD